MSSFEEYPRCKYHWKGTTVVHTAQEEAALDPGWTDTPAAFEAYRGPRPPKSPDQDPVKWVDAWEVAGLSREHRNRTKAQLLRADASFWRSPEAASAETDAMRQAFTGVAKVLAEAGILTKAVLQVDIPALVWDAAIAGEWYRLASEAPQAIFPEKLGHYWVWRDEEKDWKNLFYSEEREWLAWLLEQPSKDAGDDLAARRKPTESSPEPESNRAVKKASDSATASLDDPRFDFAVLARRSQAIAGYVRHWTCSEAALARTAIVDPADLSKWKMGGLPAESEKKRRIEMALKNNQPPTPAPQKFKDF